MRRSCAPSMKRAAPPETLQVNKPPSLVTTTGEPDPVVVELYNSSDNHSQVLKATAKVKPLPATSSSSSDTSAGRSQKKIHYTVVWGKITTKKHKTWEGDGTLELSGKSAFLRDENRKIIASSIEVKVDEIQEGCRLIVGSKEVELIERISENGTVVEKENEAEVAVKRRKSGKFSTGKGFRAPQVREEQTSTVRCTTVVPKEFIQVGVKTEEIAVDFVPLKMKVPPVEHQWKYNQGKGVISEVTVPHFLAKELRPHQREGVSFLYECVTGFRSIEPERFGAILADEMGLGKTLQCIALIYTLLKQGPYGKPVVKRALIVTPSSLVENWDREINKWLKGERMFTFIVGPNNKLRKYAQSPHIPILIISYEMLAKQFDELQSVKFDLVICDEGHRLKNCNIKAVTVLDGVECPRRILITGTPIQNDLQEFHSLVNFVNPGVLGSYAEFKNKYENPIVQSQQPNVLPQYQELGKQRLIELNNITSTFVLRRTQEVINKYLPPKQELVVFVHPSDLQKQLLSVALEFYEKNGPTAISPLQLITILKKICNHPSLVSSIEGNDSESLIKVLNDNLPAWNQMGPSDSSKLGIVEWLLESLIEKREKIVLVSYYSKTLDMFQGLCEHYNYKFSRLDGSTPAHDRSKIVSAFNDSNSDIFILLLSAKAGGSGLNLIGASRLVLFDNDWNPASDLQAMARIWRDGQTKQVYIYRLLTAGSIEEKIYQRQISKTSLSGTVVDQKQNLANLKFSDEELKDLFSLATSEEEQNCLTHLLLDCNCRGRGEIPETSSSDLSQEADQTSEPHEESRFKLKLGKAKSKKAKRSLKMQELMRWEHHRQPIAQEVLEELALHGSAEEIVFLFRNTVNQLTN
ncbi:DNA repair and recombination protein RAD54B-like [Uranotaenia lowii]|uniref:DNA repair and recombination protein RAD54B-like n=1 Tax=Uranotaenia lowii TaxID=190385 RepID=UPI002478B3DA|nr:DNA repair and recombination protein RAD54B-like [Uranotaenia lowii]